MRQALRSWLRFRIKLRRLRRNEHIILALLSGIVGIVVAYGAIGFRRLIDFVQILSFDYSGELLYSAALELPWWQIVLPPALGGLAVGLVVHFLMPDKRPEGVPDVIAANALSDTRMPLRSGLAAAFVSASSLGVGASTGREGPIVHLGATIASAVSTRLHLSPAQSRTLLGCAVASAVASSFNAPIAGVFFALEVILGHYALHAFAPIVIASVVGTIVSRIHLGDFPAFTIPDYAFSSFWEFPAFVVLGATAAGIAIIFMRSTFLAEDIFKRLPLPRWSHASVAGLIVGGIAVFYPQILGVGYEATNIALHGGFGLMLLIFLIGLKTAATSICIGAGFGGGIFSPALFLGAMTGGAFGIMAAYVFPELAAAQGLYAIVGMGAVASAVLGAPISTFLIVFELIGDYELAIAIMLATATASLISHQSFGQSLFHLQLMRRGLDLRGGRARHLLRTMTVAEVMSPEFLTVRDDEDIEQIRIALSLASHGTVMVVDQEGAFAGTLSINDVREAAFDPDLRGLIRAADVARPRLRVLQANDTLARALNYMDATGDEHVPVIDDRQDGRLVGVLHHRDALLAYNRALLEERREEHSET